MGLSVFEGPVVLESDQFGPIGPLRVKRSQKKNEKTAPILVPSYRMVKVS